MKYRDIITLFEFIIFILSLAYALGVDNSICYIPVILFVILIYTVYKLYIEN